MTNSDTAALISRRKILWVIPWTDEPRTARIIRFAGGITISVAIAFGIEWPLSFLVPVLASVFLAMPLPAPTVHQLLINMLYVWGAFAVGLFFTLVLLPFPLIYAISLGVVLFHTYYLLNRGGPFILVLMILLAVLILPMMAQIHDGLAGGFAAGFVFSGMLSILMFWLAHRIFPDPVTAQLPPRKGFQPGYSGVAAEAALKSTIVVLPIVILFIAYELSGQLLVMVFIAIFSLSPQLTAGKAAGIKSIKSTILGGIAALVFYHILIVVPEFHFFIALMLLTSLLFALNIYSDKATAAYYSSGFTALLVLVSTSMGEGADITQKFFIRVLLIALATVYVVYALKALEHFWHKKQVP